MSNHSSAATMGDVTGLEDRKSQDNADTSVKNNEGPQQENKQGEEKGTTNTVETKNDPAFKNARKSTQAMIRRATKLKREAGNIKQTWTYGMAESALDEVDELHKTALIAVRKAIEVEKTEGEKLKVELQEEWHEARRTFANVLYDYDYDESDPDLNPYSDLWESYEEDEEQDGVELKE
ncbi:hypothetical protein G7054_g14762 [Neopestalotiopsis clavispora]|nr:hypothetical protein G7054_g14762 [Neopestalotiopsis clavispora]